LDLDLGWVGFGFGNSFGFGLKIQTIIINDISCFSDLPNNNYLASTRDSKSSLYNSAS
jgi:hypothetical protein